VSEYYTGQIMMTGFSYAQKNFAQCNGQILSIAQNQTLFALLGVAFGGNGVTTFALPDLRSRTPVGSGFASQDGGWQPPAYMLGQVGGRETVTLIAGQLPAHIHAPTTVTSDAGTGAQPPRGTGLTLGSGSTAGGTLYGDPNALVPLASAPLGQAGGNQAHPNIQPYETINFNIALYGIFPSRN
jgi:microcystin-dependent protein